MSPPAAPFISVIIPNHNGEKTIGRCLDAALASKHADFEIIVVDDCSTDSSVNIILKYPCRLIRLPEHGGAAKARNYGARNSTGEVLFFVDGDCLLQTDTLARVAAAYLKEGVGTIIGGTYTWLPYDHEFFSIFQSIYIHYSEIKNPTNPDYIATHAMVIAKKLFQESTGFDEQFMPILEDVEFSHRLKKKGARLLMDEKILVQHIFNFSLLKSLSNGIRKSKYWFIYSVKNKDLLSDSGTASLDFKFNVVSCFITATLVLAGLMLRTWSFGLPALLLYGSNLYFNRVLFRAFLRVGGPFFAIRAVLYYTFVYPFAVGIGIFSGLLSRNFRLRP